MTRIAELDLRSDKVKEAESACRQRERAEAALDKMWDFPVYTENALTPREDMKLYVGMVFDWHVSVSPAKPLWHDNWPVYSLVMGLALLAGLLVGWFS